MSHVSSVSTRAPRAFNRRTLLASALLVSGVFGTSLANAQAAFPSKPMTIIVPFAAGGTTDILARIVGQALSAELGQPVVDRKSVV